MNDWDRSLGTLGVSVSLVALFVTFMSQQIFSAALIIGVCMELMIFLTACFLLGVIPNK